jgi:hypothetical protein
VAVSEVEDVHAISKIVYSYAELLDLGDIEGCGRVFTRAVLRIDGASDVFEGAEAVQGYIENTIQLYDRVPGTKRLVTNLVVDVDDQRRSATARSYYTALQARPGFSLQPILAGRWHDRFERDGDEWWLTERLIHPDLNGDIRFHIKGLPS